MKRTLLAAAVVASWSPSRLRRRSARASPTSQRLRRQRRAPTRRSSSSTASPVTTPRRRPAAWRSTPADLAPVERHAEAWEKVVRKLRTGMMPPEGAPRPAPRGARGIHGAARSAARSRGGAQPDPGAPALHRLNRAEYANVIRDLLALDVDAARSCRRTIRRPASTTSPTCWGCRRRSSRGTRRPPRGSAGSRSAIPPSASIAPPTGAGDLSQEAHVDGLPLGTRGGIVVRAHVPARRGVRPPGGAGRRRRLGGRRRHPGRDDLYVTIDGVRVEVQGAAQLR